MGPGCARLGASLTRQGEPNSCVLLSTLMGSSLRWKGSSPLRAQGRHGSTAGAGLGTLGPCQQPVRAGTRGDQFSSKISAWL